jgi:hypothetical protein
MDDKQRCQSCGNADRRIGRNFGTEADGSVALKYCTFCYQNGGFTNPDQSLDEMVASSVDFMTENLGFSAAEATELSNNVIRKLKRWQ